MAEDDQTQAAQQPADRAGEQAVVVFDQFQGLNTSTTRPGVPEAQAYWLDGWMPVDKYNLRTMPGASLAFYTTGGTIVFFVFGNIGATAYMIVFLLDGSVDAVNTSNGAVTHLLPAGTISAPSQISIGFTQWNRQYLIIVANQANGFWVWDGTVVLQPGTLQPSVTITNAGTGYGAVPTVAVSGGHGVGATFTATVAGGAVSSITVTNPGTGYQNGDVVTMVIGAPTAGVGATITLTTAFNGTYSFITSAVVTAGGAGYSANAKATVTGGLLYGTGTTATLALTVVLGVVTAATVTYPGAYTNTVGIAATVTDPQVQATATAAIMPFGVQGSAVATYQARLWIAFGATVIYSAPGTPTDFSGGNGGGNFVSGSSTLKISYTQLIAANGFLYLVGDSSIDYISGVQTSGTPPATTFTLQNADPEVGTPYPWSVTTFGRDIMFANYYGVHRVYGGAVTKVSEPLDGVYNSLVNFNGQILSSAEAVIFGKKVWCFLTAIKDPISGNGIAKVFLWNGRQWWASSQQVNLTYIKHQEVSSVITCWGTDTTSIYNLFSQPSAGFAKILQTKLWDRPGGYPFTKSQDRFWLIAQVNNSTSPGFAVSFDSELGSTSPIFPTPAGTGLYVMPPQAIGQQGALFGVTITSIAADVSLISCAVAANIVQYRG